MSHEEEEIYIPEELDVLTLVPYETNTSSSELSQSMGYFGSSEYKDIDTALLTSKQEAEARSFVSKVENFIVRLSEQTSDSALNDSLRDYIQHVGTLQFHSLSDLMSLVSINKMMLENVVARINASQAEDYAIIQTYSNLVNQHIKLSRELSTIYKSIPSTIKKMVQEVTNEQNTELDDSVQRAIITQDYGETQFNSSKELLKTLREQQEAS